MIKLSQKQLLTIASDLEMGMRCYINKNTGDIITVPVLEDMFFDEDQEMEDLLRPVRESPEKYLEVERMPSAKMREVMNKFATEEDDAVVKQQLIDALQGQRPFRAFKRVVSSSVDFRQRWFVYKANCYRTWVEKQLLNII
ncbi:MAG TPA: UPF0158 family protein [Williamwhitmania sp.]|nr:UPF0158 family protein [Williamwhitmania sp.]